MLRMYISVLNSDWTASQTNRYSHHRAAYFPGSVVQFWHSLGQYYCMEAYAACITPPYPHTHTVHIQSCRCQNKEPCCLCMSKFYKRDALEIIWLLLGRLHVWGVLGTVFLYLRSQQYGWHLLPSFSLSLSSLSCFLPTCVPSLHPSLILALILCIKE